MHSFNKGLQERRKTKMHFIDKGLHKMRNRANYIHSFEKNLKGVRTNTFGKGTNLSLS